jgi:predicted nucleotidyltransferase
LLLIIPAGNSSPMTLRDIPDSMNPATVAEIDARLDAIRREQRVAIPLAIESGSRAWGFPSPDSDYDCRFIFVRRADDYLSLFPQRDVIETPLEGELDVNGWDLAKALKLLLKGNAVVIEWLTSPILYSADRWFRDEMQALAGRLADRQLVARHYLHLGERQRRSYFADSKQVPLKKVFYALRPAAALRWLRHHPERAVAPMHFPTLLAECAAPNDVRDMVGNLIARKAVTHELGSGELPPAIAAFIDSEFLLAREVFDGGPRPATPAARADAQNFFRAALARFT